MPQLTLQSKKVTEDDLRREFEIYGTIERIRLVEDRKGKSRSYAFIVYERERDMKGEFCPATSESHSGLGIKLTYQPRTKTQKAFPFTTKRF